MKVIRGFCVGLNVAFVTPSLHYWARSVLACWGLKNLDDPYKFPLRPFFILWPHLLQSWPRWKWMMPAGQTNKDQQILPTECKLSHCYFSLSLIRFVFRLAKNNQCRVYKENIRRKTSWKLNSNLINQSSQSTIERDCSVLRLSFKYGLWSLKWLDIENMEVDNQSNNNIQSIKYRTHVCCNKRGGYGRSCMGEEEWKWNKWNAYK